MLDEWEIYSLSGNNANTIYTAPSEKGTLMIVSSFVIKLHTKLIMGWDEEDPKNKELEFMWIAFSPGAYIKLDK